MTDVYLRSIEPFVPIVIRCMYWKNARGSSPTTAKEGRSASTAIRPEETTMLNCSESPRHGKVSRCAVCDGKFGLVRYYSWRTALCSKKCVDHFKCRQERDSRWLWRLRAA